MTKRIHLGRAAQMGLESALLAGKGFTGPSTVLEGKFGFFNVFSPSPQPERLLANIGKVWLGKGAILKPYACHGTHQHIVQGLDQFKSSHPIAPKEIRKVRVAGSLCMVHKHDDCEPNTVMGAQLSMLFGVAIALAKDIASPYVYSEETLWDKEVRELAKRVEAAVDPRFKEFDANNPHGEITIEMNNGEHHIIKIAGFKGLPTTPFNFKDACDKLRTYAAPIMDQKQTETIIHKVRDLERVGDMAEVAGLIGK